MTRHQEFVADILENDGVEEVRNLAAMPATFDKFNKVRCGGCRKAIAQGERHFWQRGMLVTCESCHQALVAAVA